jgi:hypothetical protein
VAAGVPTDNDRVFCTSGSVNNTCYFYNASNVVRDVAKASCAARNGWLVAYNSAEEQLEVEKYFTSEQPQKPLLHCARSMQLWYNLLHVVSSSSWTTHMWVWPSTASLPF